MARESEQAGHNGQASEATDGKDSGNSGNSGDSENSKDSEDSEDIKDSEDSEDEGADKAKAKDSEPSAATVYPRLLFQTQQNEVQLERWQGRQSVIEKASTRKRLKALLDKWD
ncbi:hypothetical protein AAL_03270 [Moelleriella libera RCEF 2490]|uniref:Uncharacterized protein n=1 Tax=Moelleriella libera RCEF 2490 TaxID=1081109 RepID=A0A162IUX1_9HYPO|nr:hypothetical protein AAL_03270 [Moelleriella libera RCEF 2490]